MAIVGPGREDLPKPLIEDRPQSGFITDLRKGGSLRAGDGSECRISTFSLIGQTKIHRRIDLAAGQEALFPSRR